MTKEENKKKKVWRSVLRLKEENATALKEALEVMNSARPKKDKVSLNTLIEAIIELWLEE